MQHTGARFKVGDCVRVTERFDSFPAGLKGTVTRIDDSSVPHQIKWDNGFTVWMNWTRPIELIPPAATPTTSGPYMAQHNPDGTLTLMPVQEAEKAAAEKQEAEEAPEMAMGQVWRCWADALLLITDENRAVYITGSLIGVQYHKSERLKDEGAFAYPSLAAAIAAGAIS